MNQRASSPDVDALWQETVAATEASKARRAQLEFVSEPDPEETTLKLVSEDETPAPARSAWRERLIDGERGLRHALRSECTLLGYAVAAAVTAMAAGVLQVPTLQLVIIGFVAVQAVLVELGRIAVREMTERTHKAASIATAASLLAAFTAAATIAVILGLRFANAF